MTALLVPIAVDVLLVRGDGVPFAPTKMATPAPNATNPKRQRLLPMPFQDDIPRMVGAYLHWALPDGLTRARPPAAGQAPTYPAIPERWLVFRLTGNAAGPTRRVLTAWLLPDVNATPSPASMANALGTTPPAVGAPPSKPLTVLGTGDLSWAAYYDNVTDQLALFDPLDGVQGAVTYLVCGWYTHIGLDPLNAVGAADLTRFLAERGWSLPPAENASGSRQPTSTLFHGAVAGLGWPSPGWPGDGGLLGVEVGGPPAAADIDVVVADTIAEAIAALAVSPNGAPADAPTQRVMQATLEGMLSELAHPNGPAALDTSLHMSRFASLASDIDSETIWQTSDLAPASEAPRSSMDRAVASGHGLAGAVAASRHLAGDEPAAATGPDLGGSLVAAERSTPRTFAPVDPVILLRGASRSFKHGGDGRLTETGTLLVRLSGDPITSFRASGTSPLDPALMLPADFETALATLTPPGDVLSLVQEVISMDPSSASDLSSSTATVASPDATARAAWLSDPSQVPTGVVGVLPSPIGIVGAVRPWTPLHVEWQLDWLAAKDGARAFLLGDVDFVVPSSAEMPETVDARSISGRGLLSASPARIAAGGVASAMGHLRAAGLLEDSHVGDHFAASAAEFASEGGRAARVGLDGAAADQDLLAGSLEDFLAQLRGEDTSPVVAPPSSSATSTSHPTNADVVRAGLVRMHRARVVDCFGQYVDLLGSSAQEPADDNTLLVGAGEAVAGAPGVVALVPRFNAKARVLLRYSAADGSAKDADTAISPLCGFILPSPIDGSLEFFDAGGKALGRIRADSRYGATWEEDPGQPSSFGRKPSAAIPGNLFLGHLADAIVAADTALALRTRTEGEQTALEALNQLIDITRWTVDSIGSVGDEHASLLLGHPIAVMRAAIKVEVQGAAAHSNAPTTAVPVKLGTLAHTQDGLLGYFVNDVYDTVRAVDPAVGVVVPEGGQAINSTYVDGNPSFVVQPGRTISLTLLVVPGSHVHVTLGLLPQKQVGMRREWVSNALATLTPNWRYGPVLLDQQVTRIPIASDVRGIWTWYHRPNPTGWASESIVNANATAVVAPDPVQAQHGWIRLELAADPDFDGIPVEVGCITKPIRDAHHGIQGIGGVNGDGSRWWMTRDQAVQMIETGRFFFYVRDGDSRIKIITDITDRGTKYIRTVGDANSANDLLSLTECPPR